MFGEVETFVLGLETNNNKVINDIECKVIFVKVLYNRLRNLHQVGKYRLDVDCKIHNREVK
mgnify:CR=1 FL=1